MIVIGGGRFVGYDWGNTFGGLLWPVDSQAATMVNPAADPIQVTLGPTLTMDPNGVAPLAGVVDLETNVPVRVTLRISDDTGTWVIEFAEYLTQHSLFSRRHNEIIIDIFPLIFYTIKTLNLRIIA